MSLEHKAVVLPKISTDSDGVEIHLPGLLSQLLISNPNLYGEMQESRSAYWRNLVRAFEETPDDFYSAWHYLNRHPLFWTLGGTRNKPSPVHEKYLQDEYGIDEGALEISVVKVDPETDSINQDDIERNTQTQIWYEICMTHWPSQQDDIRVHAYELDGGSSTYEECVVKAAKQVHEVYGNDRRVFDEEHGGRCVD